MDLKEYINKSQQSADINESLLLLGFLTAGLLGGVMGGLFGLFNKKEKKEFDKNMDKTGKSIKSDSSNSTPKDTDKSKLAAVDNKGKDDKKDSQKSTELSDDDIYKTQIVMNKLIKGKSGPEVDDAKMAMAQVNAIMYDEKGNPVSPRTDKHVRQN